MDWIFLCEEAEFGPADRRVFKHGHLEILVIRQKEGWAAVSNICPHAGGKLESGRVENGALTCMHHGASFDLKSGAIRMDMIDEDLVEMIEENGLPFGPLKTFPLRVEAGRIEVGI